MAAFGTITLYALMVLATWTGALALVGSQRRSMSMINAARLSLYATAAVATLSIVILAHAFATSDFSIIYVHSYSDWSMPMFYKLTAIWGGQEGSLLFWAWLLAVASAYAVHLNQERLRELLPYVIIVLMVVLDFFCLLLLISADPFSTFLVDIPSAGKGLNPLLQNAFMVTHPPALYVGYVIMAIPFSFAVAALIAGQTDESWIMASRPWAVAAWYALTLGLVLGMLWAYEELGWGGYWAWDPVENAGLIPWLTSTAFIHSVMIQERRQMFKIWNMVLAILTFELTIFGTFLTRSGFIQSVHAFARSNIGWYFLVFMGLVALAATLLIIWRRPLLRSRGTLESMRSREFFFVINNWVLLTAAFLIITLTIFPNISVLFGDKLTIGAPAFNRWMIPIGLTLLFLSGVGPMIGWGKSSLRGLMKQFWIPAVIAALVGLGLFAAGMRRLLPLVTFQLCAFVFATVVQELIQGARIRRRKSGGDPLTALVGLVRRNRRRYGGYIVHLGVILMYVGFAGQAFKEEAELVLKKGQRVSVGAYTLRFDGVETTRDEQKQMTTATLTIYRGEERLGAVKPARWVYFKHQDKPTSEVGIRRSARDDLFVVLAATEPGAAAATFKIIVNPLVNWIWIGFVLMTLGALIALIPARVRRRRRSSTAAAALILVAAGALSLAASPGQALAAGERGAVKQVPAAETRLFTRLACMCPNCPRIPLASCQCGFAGKERAAIRKKIALGWSDEQITRWYVERRGQELGRQPFGEEALTIPPDSGFNRLFWLLPYALSLLAIVAMLAAGRRWVRGREAAGADGPAAAPAADDDREDADDPEDGARPAAVPRAGDEYEELLERELRKLD